MLDIGTSQRLLPPSFDVLVETITLLKQLTMNTYKVAATYSCFTRSSRGAILDSSSYILFRWWCDEDDVVLRKLGLLR
jgi:hypothetical protein